MYTHIYIYLFTYVHVCIYIQRNNQFNIYTHTYNICACMHIYANSLRTKQCLLDKYLAMHTEQHQQHIQKATRYHAYRVAKIHRMP